MIKFFRFIRKDLIHRGQTSRYLKYAFGEIALVVIGILLALQINNWNEKRKTRIQERYFIASIKQDLIADVTSLSLFIHQLESEYEELKNEKVRVSNASFNKDSLINYVKNKINPFVVSFEGFNNNSFESLKTSGKIEIISESLKNKLYELSVKQNITEKEYIAYRKDYVVEIQELNSKYPLPVSFTFIESDYIDTLTWNDLDEKDLILRLNSWGTIKANFYRIMIINFKEVLDQTTAILNTIE